MEEKEIKTQIEQLGKQIDEKISGMVSKAEAGETIGKANTQELQRLVKDYSDLQKQIDEMALAMARKGSEGGLAPVSGVEQLADFLKKEGTEFDAFRKAGFRGRASVEGINMKAALSSSTATVGLIEPNRQAGIITPFDRLTSVLDLLTVSPTSAPTIKYARESSYTSNGAYVAEGTDKPEDEIAFTTETADAKTLATTMRIPKQMLDDVQGLAGYLSVRIPRKLNLIKENNVLFGDGTGENLEGITTVASGFAPGADVIVASPNRYDVIGAAILQASILEYAPDGVVLHKNDLFMLRHAKDTQGRYLFPELREAGTIDGVRVAQTTIAAMKGKYLLGDFGLAAQMFQRQAMTIEFFDQDRDNVKKNLITVRAEERHALAIYRPDAFIYGTFAAGITDLTS